MSFGCAFFSWEQKAQIVQVLKSRIYEEWDGSLDKILEDSKLVEAFWKAVEQRYSGNKTHRGCPVQEAVRRKGTNLSTLLTLVFQKLDNHNRNKYEYLKNLTVKAIRSVWGNLLRIDQSLKDDQTKFEEKIGAISKAYTSAKNQLQELVKEIHTKVQAVYCEPRGVESNNLNPGCSSGEQSGSLKERQLQWEAQKQAYYSKYAILLQQRDKHFPGWTW